jgi:hypothetical protein
MLHHDASNDAGVVWIRDWRGLCDQAKHPNDVGVVQAGQYLCLTHEAVAMLGEAIALGRGRG